VDVGALKNCHLFFAANEGMVKTRPSRFQTELGAGIDSLHQGMKIHGGGK
jgi:hypothetical protein